MKIYYVYYLDEKGGILDNRSFTDRDRAEQYLHNYDEEPGQIVGMTSFVIGGFDE